jgi:two-component system, OmpR family, response regulator
MDFMFPRRNCFAGCDKNDCDGSLPESDVRRAARERLGSPLALSRNAKGMVRILVIEDDPKTAAEIAAALTDHGHEAALAGTGREGLLRAATEDFGAVVLDRMLPGGLDGLGVLATLRATGNGVPVLVLSALSDVDERVRGLKAGGDDYLTKPFEFLELTARLDVLVRRRAGPRPESSLRVGDLEMDLLTQTVRRAGQPIELLPREFRLLEYLMRHAGQIVTRTMIFEEVWHYHYDEPTNVIDVHVSRLRRKIDLVGAPPLIETVRGAGYSIHAPR